jgi:hypothetical protein
MFVLCMTPDPRIMTEKAAPKAAAWDMPRVNGDPRGLRRIDCMAAPATDSPAPATIAASAWGMRMFQTIMSKRLETLMPSSVLATTDSGTPAAPSDKETASPIIRPATARAIKPILKLT